MSTLHGEMKKCRITDKVILPTLTSGSINRILEWEEVSGAVMQILGCKRIPGAGNVRYRLLISDGVTASPFVMLGTMLNHLVTNNQLENFTIVRVDECVCNQIQPDRKVIILLNLTVLVPGAEVDEKIGNPIILVSAAASAGDANENNTELKSVLNAAPQNVIIPQGKDLAQALTAGSINQILEGEEVSGAVIQILGCQRIPGNGNVRYRLLISDGVTTSDFVMLGTMLNHLVTNNQLENFTIVRVDECVCNEVKPGRKVIILLNLVILVPGAEVGEKIGNPIVLVSAAAPAGDANENNTESKSVLNTAPENVIPQGKDLVQVLTGGSINRILEGEEVSGAVMQILGCKRIPGTGNDRYRLLISDGVTGCPFAMLGTQLNHLVINNQMEKFTLVRVDKCVCNQIQPDRKVIILLNLTVLVPGAEVGEKLGNPINSTTGAAPAGDANENNTESKSVLNTAPQNVIPQGKDLVQVLTAGSINRILKGEEVSGAVMQILGCKRIPGNTGNDRYRLLISDGVTGCPFAMLGTQLNHLVINNQMEKFTLVRVDKCVCNQIQPDRKVIILLNLTVLVPGAEVGKKLGSPISSTTGAAPAGNVTENNTESKSVLNSAPQNVIIPQGNDLVQALTAGSIKRILEGEEVSGAVMQILGCQRIPDTGNDRYRLLISDGVIASPFDIFGTQLNHLATNNQLEKFTIVRVNNYICNEVQPGRKVIILLNLVILVPGAEVGEKLGSPIFCPGHVTENNTEPMPVLNIEPPNIFAQLVNGSVQPVHPVARWGNDFNQFQNYLFS